MKRFALASAAALILTAAMLGASVPLAHRVERGIRQGRVVGPPPKVPMPRPHFEEDDEDEWF